MRVLLDTNAFLWWVGDDSRLGHKARETISNPNNAVYISSVSLFESSIKVHIGKLQVDFKAIDQEITASNIFELKFDTLDAGEYINLPSLPQNDPFDRAIISQAISKHLVLISSDNNILEIQLNGLQIINAKK